MQLFKNFCTPKVNKDGLLVDFHLNVPENYNFGYELLMLNGFITFAELWILGYTNRNINR